MLFMGILLLLLFLSIFIFSLCLSVPFVLLFSLVSTLHEAALMESSSRFHSEALSHSLWLLSALLTFVCLQGFSPADASLFNTLVTSLSKCLAHQSSISASFTAFLGLKCRNFYLSHLPAYFSESK